jgi:hypothetical protein
MPVWLPALGSVAAQSLLLVPILSSAVPGLGLPISSPPARVLFVRGAIHAGPLLASRLVVVVGLGVAVAPAVAGAPVVCANAGATAISAAMVIVLSKYCMI